MAKIRTIKPEFWDNEKLAALPYGARLLFIGLWNFADDAGVIRSSDKYIKSKVFPYDDNLRLTEVNKWLQSLVKYRMLVPISYQNESYYMVRSLTEHQRIDDRYAKYIIPKDDALKALSEATFSTTAGQQCGNCVATSLIGVGKDSIGGGDGKEGEIDTVIQDAGSITPPLGNVGSGKQTACHPSADEVAEYFKSKGYKPEAGYKAHDYYATNDWKDSYGKPVKNWKQKMIAVWFKPENIDNTPKPYVPTQNDNWI